MIKDDLLTTLLTPQVINEEMGIAPALVVTRHRTRTPLRRGTKLLPKRKDSSRSCVAASTWPPAFERWSGIVVFKGGNAREGGRNEESGESGCRSAFLWPMFASIQFSKNKL